MRVIGKGEGALYTNRQIHAQVLKGWLREPQRGDGHVLFPTSKVIVSASMVSSTC